MGCDFSWSGAVRDRRVQERAVRFLPWRPEQLVVPVPELISPAEIHRRRFFGDTADHALRYPFDFFGVAGERGFWHDEPYERRNMWEFDQLVFDRSDGGRLVTVLPPDPAHLARGEWLTVKNGGYSRRCGGGQETYLALMLVLLRLRYCLAMELADDYGVCEQVQGNLLEWGLLRRLCDESLLMGDCWNRYVAAAKVHEPERFTGGTE